MILGSHRAGEIDRPSRNVSVDIDTSGKDHQTRSVDRTPARDRRHKLAIFHIKVAYFAVDSIGWIVNSSTSDSEHSIWTFQVLRLPTTWNTSTGTHYMMSHKLDLHFQMKLQITP
jgi:hypothetical protein